MINFENKAVEKISKNIAKELGKLGIEKTYLEMAFLVRPDKCDATPDDIRSCYCPFELGLEPPVLSNLPCPAESCEKCWNRPYNP